MAVQFVFYYCSQTTACFIVNKPVFNVLDVICNKNQQGHMLEDLRHYSLNILKLFIGKYKFSVNVCGRLLQI